MSRKISNYFQRLAEEFTNSINIDYDLTNYQFNNFHYINFYLINHFILEASKEDFFIGIPEDDYREGFFESILYSVSLIKYFQNFCNLNDENYSIKKDDLILIKDDIYVYRRTRENKIWVSKKFPIKGTEENAEWVKEKRNYPRLLNDKIFQYQKRVTAELLIRYRDFFKLKLRDNRLDFLSQFPNKTLIISSKEISNINSYIPFRYWTKSGNQKHSLPIEVMIEICNDFKTAKKHLLDKGNIFDELIIIGDTKYNKDEDFSDILKAKGLGQFKNLILIGSYKPTTAHQFLTWDWTNEEVKIANNEPVSTFKNKEIEFPELFDITNELSNKIDEYKQSENLNLSEIKKFCNFYLKLSLPCNEKTAAIIDDYFNRISMHFESDEIEKLFHDADIYEPEKIEAIKKDLLSFFTRYGTVLKERNPKLEYIIEKAKDNFQNAVIVDKHFASTIETYFAQNGIDRTKVISERKSSDSTHNFEKWIKDETLNTKARSYFIPYAVNIEQFKSLMNLKGQVSFLSYANLDSLRFTRINEYFISETETKITNKDRAKFSKITYQTTELTKEHSFDSLFLSAGKDVKEIVAEEKLLDEYRDEIEYKIVFTDNTSLVAKSSKAVFLIDGTDQLKISIGDSFEGATIRFYRNETPEDFEKTLKHFDKDGLLNKISKYSKAWKDALQTLKTHFGGESVLLKKLTDRKLKIAPVTFSNYFKADNETHFPRLQTLKVIKEICIESAFGNLPFVTEYNEVLKYRAKDKEIRQSVGRGLSTDLLDWVATGEKSENLKSIPDEILNNIKSSVQEKTIRTKKIIDRN